jgi:hypothetical protein
MKMDRLGLVDAADPLTGRRAEVTVLAPMSSPIQTLI